MPDTTAGDDLRGKLKPWTDIIAGTRRAFLRRVQADNECVTTGDACRVPQQCGCWLEMEDAINDEF